MSVSEVLAPKRQPSPPASKEWAEDIPIRDELCGSEHLAERARSLARSLPSRPGRHNQLLRRRLQDNHRFLDEAHGSIGKAARDREPLPPDAEWLLDNYFIIASVLRQVRTDLPRGFQAKLPVLAEGPRAGWPRTYELAVSLIASTDSILEEEQIVCFVRAFQEISPLTIGEIWAIPTMLRLALLENLRHLAGQMLQTRDDRLAAEEWARLASDNANPPALPSEPRDAYLIALHQALRGPSPMDHAVESHSAGEGGAVLEQFFDWLSKHKRDLHDALQREHQRQATNQVSVGNCVTSLRLINVLDWSVFFEKVSFVDKMLRGESAAVYPKQDFATRDRYRRAVEDLSRGSALPETALARLVVHQASQEAGRHVGWYLVGPGRLALENRIGYRAPLRERTRRFLTGHPNTVYFGSVGLITLALVVLAIAVCGVAPLLAIAVALVTVLPASEIAVALTNFLLCRILRPRVLAKLDFKDGIASDCPTFVVIPCMLYGPDSARQLLERLELHYLANPDPQLWFALLTDFADAPSEHMPEDDAYVQAALDGIAKLNRRYARGEGGTGSDRFFLFHRRRLWNASEGCWMGWERKRGKLDEFNRLLRGASDTTLSVQSGGIGAPPRIRFVLTLDADTVLPREAARHMVSTLAHPLNQATLSFDGRRVREGYAILQPRVSFLYRTGLRSWFARIYAGSAGIDPYSSAVSDVYQDLFGRGTFTGKGLYDVDAFAATVGHAFPENHILSHDLIESNFATCALTTDIEVFDEFPAKYHAYARRDHRWVRGDWQLLPWLGRRVPSGEQGYLPNVLPALERWKIVDNLRRSLVPPALVVLLVLGWTVLPGSALGWSLFALAALAMPLLMHLVDSLVGLIKGAPPRALLREVQTTTRATVCQVLLGSAFLAHQAPLMLDAIGRTLYRLFVSRRRLLEWETAAATDRRLGDGPRRFLQTMWLASAFALLTGALVVSVAPAALVIAGPWLVLWFLSPMIAYLVSRPLGQGVPSLTASQTQALRRVARKTWGFFERFVGPEDNGLPPDNFQEEPKGQVAHRTSPTNMGLGLLSALAAHDLGYVTLTQLAQRVGDTFETWEKLPRHRGHFLNWYHTRTLQPLHPSYVSTVDSGNLLGCLWTLKHGLREKLRQPIPSVAALTGLGDTLRLLEEEVDKLQDHTGAPADAWSDLARQLVHLKTNLASMPQDLYAWQKLWGVLEQQAVNFLAEARGLGDMLPALPDQLLHWASALLDGIRQQQAELKKLAPWLSWLVETTLPGEDWHEIKRELGRSASVLSWEGRLPEVIEKLRGQKESALTLELIDLLECSAAPQLAEELRTLADEAEAFSAAMDFRFLYNPRRNLFTVGYNVTQDKLDLAHYDLLASEACLASFLAIARGDAPRKHWFQLGRLALRVSGHMGLISWGGTMFEYLMPRLLLPTAPATLLDTAQRAALAGQIAYGKREGKPWGISESAFYFLDSDRDYQYQSFGVPDLALKRDVGQDYVIAPYATLLAVDLDPRAVLANLTRIRAEGGEGPFGFYEAIDYTPSRLARGKDHEVVRSYMAHHQGMALVALANRLTGNLMPRRLRTDPRVRAAELLLDERVPVDAPLIETSPDTQTDRQAALDTYPVSRRLTSPDTPSPRTHLLSNGRYSVMLTNAGAGVSTCDGLDVTRWRADAACDPWGQFVYLRDLANGKVWSCGYQPTRARPVSYEVVYSVDKAEIRRVDDEIETVLEIVVAPDRNVEVRRVTLHNLGTKPRDLDATSYVEVALNHHAADRAHPAFGKLFLETEWLPSFHALLCRRRPRAKDQKPIWAVHVLATDASDAGETTFETDRSRFLGRRRTPLEPAALERNAAPLSETTGSVLDPILSLRRQVHLEPSGRVTLTFSTGLAETREEALLLADQFHTLPVVNRAFELAWAHAQLELRHQRLSVEQTHLFQRLAGHVIFPAPGLRAAPDAGRASTNPKATGGVASLWRMGISGDVPILLVRMSETKDMPLFEELLSAHAYWRSKGLMVDLVLLDEGKSEYHEELRHQALDLARVSAARDLIDKPGGIFVRQAGHLHEEERGALFAAAHVVLLGERGPLASQIEVLQRPRPLPPLLPRHARPRPADPIEAGELQFFNGRGGFRADGKEFIIPATSDAPPAPWINVIANPDCGFLISDSGSGFTWTGNSQTNRLTPWSNDPVSDPPGEAIYLRDEANGAVWSPTPLPNRSPSPTEVRHGLGYTTFRQVRGDLEQELTLFVPLEAPAKCWLLKVRNRGSAPRSLSATFYAEWVLGVDREQTGQYVTTWEDEGNGALMAANPFNADFGQSVAFADVSQRSRTLTADRVEFLGRNRGTDAPAALEREALSGRTGACLDPCAALQTRMTLQPGEEQTLVFVLGQAVDAAAARQCAERLRQPEAAQTALKEVIAHWDRLLGAVQVRTPNPALDHLLNGWLLYQTLSCRVWGRSAFYQSGGAYGFRDQLQDVLALVHAAPDETRTQILRASSRQFVEGDVQHWWHPPAGRGIRTRFSDDFLWLPFVVCHYVAATGDTAILNEQIPFLQAPLLEEGQEEVFGEPAVASEQAPLYEHCIRALDNGWKLGAHGLPLMGTGDWNDGMNKVGAEGKGESVWVAWFQMVCLTQFATLAEARGDGPRAALCRQRVEQLRQAVENQAWDGAWYRRAYFDDGTPLGSATNDECRIDSLAQTWAVISGKAEPTRARQAMSEVMKQLVRWDDRLILLFDPPFDTGSLQPGYIKGYVPGIRENGGQYTHAAIWVIQATALLGKGTQAHALFDLINPIRHAATPEAVERYRVEPYVVAADVYGCPPHVGRGGWTWYTGSASWLYRAGLETLLGFQREGNSLRLNPAIPANWPAFQITYRHGRTVYRILVENPAGVERGIKRVMVDGVAREDQVIPLVDDGQAREVRVEMG